MIAVSYTRCQSDGTTKMTTFSESKLRYQDQDQRKQGGGRGGVQGLFGCMSGCLLVCLFIWLSVWMDGWVDGWLSMSVCLSGFNKTGIIHVCLLSRCLACLLASGSSTPNDRSLNTRRRGKDLIYGKCKHIFLEAFNLQGTTYFLMADSITYSIFYLYFFSWRGD